MKYPEKNKELIKVPLFKGDTWWCSLLNANGTQFESGFAGHLTEESCWICCHAHNQRVGYSKKDVKKIIEHFNHGKKDKKGKKTKKDKKRKDSRNKVKGGKKR